jgi:hypothetical protein
MKLETLKNNNRIYMKNKMNTQTGRTEVLETCTGAYMILRKETKTE